MQDKIVVVGARENNLKNVTVEIPRDRLVVITGLSGSGKSSLAFDTIYAEGQRRYVESLSAYARQFLGQMDKPDVDHIDGLSPAVSIDQKSASRNPRSTVGTVTEIYDYLRILFARVGIPYCPNGHGPIQRQSTDQITDAIRELPEGTKLQILAPVIRGRKGEYKSVIQEVAKAGYVRVRVDGEMFEVTDDIPMDRYKQHTIEVVVDRLVMKEGIDRRLTDSIEAALKMGKGLVGVSYELPVTPPPSPLPATGSSSERGSSAPPPSPLSATRSSSEGGSSTPPPSPLSATRSSSERGSSTPPPSPLSATQSLQEKGSSAPPPSPLSATRSLSERGSSTPPPSPLPATQDIRGEGESGEMIFSESYSCPECGFSMPELEPRMFSFNSPYGACPECTGLGTKTEFDPELIVPDAKKPLRDGAIAPFVYKSGETKEWWPDLLDGVGKAMGFDAHLPIDQLSEEQLHAVWYGLPNPVEVKMRYGRTERTFKTEWGGVLAALRKRYDQTESEWVKKDLEQYMATKPCPTCNGQRLKPETLGVRLPSNAAQASTLSIADLTAMPVVEALAYFEALPKLLTKRQLAIGERAVKEVLERLKFLNDVGLSYLTLNRNANTLAGGEAQRIRLATQIGSGLMGCLYILDEPSIGLHQRDNRKLIETLKRLRDLGNTVIVVEHDEETMMAADWLIEMGPGAGEHGGQVVSQGTPEEFVKSACETADYLSGRKRIEVPAVRRKPKTPFPLGVEPKATAEKSASPSPRRSPRKQPARSSR